MKIKYQTADGRMSVELEGSNDNDLFQKIADFQEVFEHSCGKCGCNDLKYVVREVELDEGPTQYYEIRCNKCTAKLAFGQHRKGGGIYPKRTEKDKETKKKTWLPDNGWLRWNREKKVNE